MLWRAGLTRDGPAAAAGDWSAALRRGELLSLVAAASQKQGQLPQALAELEEAVEAAQAAVDQRPVGVQGGAEGVEGLRDRAAALGLLARCHGDRAALLAELEPFAAVSTFAAALALYPQVRSALTLARSSTRGTESIREFGVAWPGGAASDGRRAPGAHQAHDLALRGAGGGGGSRPLGLLAELEEAVEAAREAAAWATTMPVLVSWAHCRLGYAHALRGTGEAGRIKALMAAADLLVDLGAPLPAPWPK